MFNNKDSRPFIHSLYPFLPQKDLFLAIAGQQISVPTYMLVQIIYLP
jgi:hypothetical protein